MSKKGGNRRRGNQWERDCINLFAHSLDLISYTNGDSYQIVSARQESYAEDAQLRDICFRNLGTSKLHELLKRLHTQCKTESLNTKKQNFSIDVLDEIITTYASPDSLPILLKRLSIPTKKTQRTLAEIAVIRSDHFVEIIKQSSLSMNRKCIDYSQYKFKTKRISYAEHAKLIEADYCIKVSFPIHSYYVLSIKNLLKILKSNE